MARIFLVILLVFVALFALRVLRVIVETFLAGRGKSGSSPAQIEGEMVKDPVCGTWIDRRLALAARSGANGSRSARRSAARGSRGRPVERRSSSFRRRRARPTGSRSPPTRRSPTGCGRARSTRSKGPRRSWARNGFLRRAIAEDRVPSLSSGGRRESGRRRWPGSSRPRPRRTSSPIRRSRRASRRCARSSRRPAGARKHSQQRTILFLDEIHRFNRAQQDVFLPFMESGEIVLIGATTENPSFELNGALLSRCKVVVLDPLAPEAIARIVRRALRDIARGLGAQGLPAGRRGALLHRPDVRRGREARAEPPRVGRLGRRGGQDQADRSLAPARAPPAQGPPLRQGGGRALQPDLGAPQVHARVRPRRDHLLAGADARGRRGAALPRAPDRALRLRGHRPGRPARASSRASTRRRPSSCWDCRRARWRSRKRRCTARWPPSPTPSTSRRARRRPTSPRSPPSRSLPSSATR